MQRTLLANELKNIERNSKRTGLTPNNEDPRSNNLGIYNPDKLLMGMDLRNKQENKIFQRRGEDSRNLTHLDKDQQNQLFLGNNVDHLRFRNNMGSRVTNYNNSHGYSNINNKFNGYPSKNY